MQRQSFITLVAAFGLLTSAPLAQAKNNLKKPLIERESRALIREQQRKEKEAAKQKAQPASAPVAPQR